MRPGAYGPDKHLPLTARLEPEGSKPLGEDATTLKEDTPGRLAP